MQKNKIINFSNTINAKFDITWFIKSVVATSQTLFIDGNGENRGGRLTVFIF